MSDYVPVPVSAAKEIADRFEKSIAIVATWDQAHGLLHVTTYGINENEKAWAASGGEIVAKALGSMPNQAVFFENYQKHCCVKSGHVVVTPDEDDPSFPATVTCVAHLEESEEEAAKESYQ